MLNKDNGISIEIVQNLLQESKTEIFSFCQNAFWFHSTENYVIEKIKHFIFVFSGN